MSERRAEQDCDCPYFLTTGRASFYFALPIDSLWEKYYMKLG